MTLFHCNKKEQGKEKESKVKKIEVQNWSQIIYQKNTFLYYTLAYGHSPR